MPRGVSETRRVARAGARRRDVHGALDELRVAPAQRSGGFGADASFFDDGHVAVGAGGVALERTRVLAHGRLHELGSRAGAAIGKCELVAAGARRGGAEPAVSHDRVRRRAFAFVPASADGALVRRRRRCRRPST